MRYTGRIVLCLIVSCLILIPGPGTADITPLDYHASPSGGGVSPKSPHETIRMDSQEVIIRLKPATYTVDAVFHLTNTGETTTEWVGFPKNAMGRAPGPRGGIADFIRFAVSVNDQSVPFAEERDLSKDLQALPRAERSRAAKRGGWLARQASFPGSATTTIRVGYEAHYDNCGMNCSKAVYIYGTGGYWKDSIGKAVFIIDSTEKGGDAGAHAEFSHTDARRHLISRKVISENIVMYEVRDLEPNPDGALSITFSTARVDKEDRNALHLAATNCRVELVQAILKKGADLNAEGSFGETPLLTAARRGCLQVARLLVENGADVNAVSKNSKTALTTALENAWFDSGQLQTARFLKDHGAKPTTLAVAAFVGDLETLQRFIAEGADISERKGRDDRTLLMAAAMGGEPEVVKLLLDMGVNVEEKDKQGHTALIVAAAAGRAEVAKLLLDRGADINARDSQRQCALTHAVSILRGHLDVVKVLLERGADINARDYPADRTILMHAAQNGHLEIVKVLLERGAHVNARDCRGKTALSLAQGKDVEEIEKVLKEHGAKK